MDDRYTIPGSGGVLRNQLGLITHAELDEAMNDYATMEWAILNTEPLPEAFNFDYLQHIHRRLLGQVVGDSEIGHWAGEIRHGAAPMTAIGTGIAYAREEFIEPGLTEVFTALARHNYFAGLAREDFFTEIADIWGYLTQIHPFRDGNTRSQTAFIDRLAIHAGHPIDWRQVDTNTLRDYRLLAINRPEPLAKHLTSAESTELADTQGQPVGPSYALKTILGTDPATPTPEHPSND